MRGQGRWFATLAQVLGAVAQSGSAPRSHRGGQGFKSPQLHRVLAGKVACSSFWLPGRTVKTVETNRDSLRPLLAVIGAIPLKDLTVQDVRAALKKMARDARNSDATAASDRMNDCAGSLGDEASRWSTDFRIC
jgi:hypothetical protein